MSVFVTLFIYDCFVFMVLVLFFFFLWIRRPPSPTRTDPLLPYPPLFRSPPANVAVVRLVGVIGAASPLRGGIDLASVAGSIEAAFSMRDVKEIGRAHV